MRILVIGASGLVGGELMEALTAEPGCGAVGTGCTRLDGGLLPLDITAAEQVRNVVREVRPDAAVLCAAMAGVDRCELEREAAWAANVEGVRHLLRACREAGGARAVLLSSDYVFDGRAGPYREDDRPHPINWYGRTKLAAERLVRAAGGGHLIVRTAWVYGWRPGSPNFIMRLAETLRAGRRLPVPADLEATPTHARDLARAIIALLRNGAGGIWHVAGPDCLSRAEFARAAAERLGLDPGLIVPVPSSALGQAAPRPPRGGLRIDKLLRWGAVRMPPLAESLDRLGHEVGA